MEQMMLLIRYLCVLLSGQQILSYWTEMTTSGFWNGCSLWPSNDQLEKFTPPPPLFFHLNEALQQMDFRADQAFAKVIFFSLLLLRKSHTNELSGFFTLQILLFNVTFWTLLLIYFPSWSRKITSNRSKRIKSKMDLFCTKEPKVWWHNIVCRSFKASFWEHEIRSIM